MIIISPFSPEGHFNLASSYSDTLQFNLALNHFKLSSEYNKENPEAFFNVGMIYYKIKDFENASKNFQKVLELDPNFSKAKEFLNKINKNN